MQIIRPLATLIFSTSIFWHCYRFFILFMITKGSLVECFIFMLLFDAEQALKDPFTQLFFVGNDTTSGALSLIMLNLALHQEAQEKLFNEIKVIFLSPVSKKSSIV